MLKEYICRDESSNYLSNFLNSMCEGFALHQILCDSEGKPVNYIFLDINQAFLEITGLQKEEVVGKTVLDIYPDIDLFWIESYGDVALSRTVRQFERYFKELDKYFKVSVFSPEKGQFITIFYDITDLKKADIALKTHQILFENAQDIVLYVGTEGHIINANRNAVLKYGYSYEELLRMKIQEIRHPAMMEFFEEQMQQADLTGTVFECIHVRKDGTSFPVEVSAKSTLIGEDILRIHIIRDITERKKSEEKIMYLANYDALTQVPNRSYLIRKLDSIMEQSRKEKLKFAIILFDIDKFKTINDTYGHNAGDTVLREAAARVQKVLRKIDTVGRLGGDEFLVIIPFIGDNNVISSLSERIIAALKPPVELDDTIINIRTSLGISVFPDDAQDVKNLIHCADIAMYHAKQKGGNLYMFYHA